MPVAKSYQSKKIVGEPYIVGDKTYVQIEGGKQVRWYSDYEYSKLYPSEKPKTKVYKTQKQVLGFVNDYITIFKGNTFENKNWFKDLGCIYTRNWGWGLPSDRELPEELPEGITPIRLDWNDVGNGEELKNEDEVIAAVEAKIYDPSPSEFQGTVGGKVEVDATVIKNIEIEGGYGISHMHEFKDANGNIYIWFTASKDIEIGTHCHLKGTVKEHKTYKNVKQTVLTRCKI